jgi:hypothetical protein
LIEGADQEIVILIGAVTNSGTIAPIKRPFIPAKNLSTLTEQIWKLWPTLEQA